MVLAQHLQRLIATSHVDPIRGLAEVEPAALASTLREYEELRMQRVFPIQWQSYWIGIVVQLAFPPVSTGVRDASHRVPPQTT